MEKYCDNLSVGVVIQNQADEILLLERARFPYGWAAPAGHVDGHGSLEQTAITEVFEEVGLTLPVTALEKVIDARRVDNQCRRLNGDHHIWTVYQARTNEDQLTPSVDETHGARWFSNEELAVIAVRTREGDISGNLVLEKIWLDFLVELNFIET